MANINLLPPSPLGSPPGSGFWNDWYEKLRTLINSIASGFSWSLITGTPTTLSGYGITDAQTKLNNSAGLAAALSDETGTGLSVFNNTPTLITPVIGAATGTSINLSSTATATALIPTGSAVPANGTYLPAANTLAFSTNSTESMRIDSAGLVGIGTTPAYKLDVGTNSGNCVVAVRAASAQPAYISIAGNGATPLTSSFDLIADNSFAYIYQRANLPMLLATNNTERLRINLDGQIILQTAGKGLSIKEGSNCKQGKSAMTTGAVTVSTTAVTASSRIFISINDAGSGALTNIGSIYVDNIIAGTSFDIRSTNALDTSSVVWLITEPS